MRDALAKNRWIGKKEGRGAALKRAWSPGHFRHPFRKALVNLSLISWYSLQNSQGINANEAIWISSIKIRYPYIPRRYSSFLSFIGKAN